VFFYSEPLVDKVYNHVKGQYELKETAGAQLQTEIEYQRLVAILQDTKKEFKIAKEVINYESLK